MQTDNIKHSNGVVFKKSLFKKCYIKNDKVWVCVICRYLHFIVLIFRLIIKFERLYNCKCLLV